MKNNVRSLDEIRAAAKAGKFADKSRSSGFENAPDPLVSQRQRSTNFTARSDGLNFPSNQPQPYSTQISVLTPSAGSLAPASAQKGVRNSTWRSNGEAVGESFGVQGSRAGTPSTVDEEPPTVFATADGDAQGFEMTVNHSKILILVSKYAQCALTSDDKECWIREIPLWVMFYEGIRAGVLEYDYGPKSVVVSYEGQVARVAMNVSQEARSDLDDLWEQQLINTLTIASEDFQPIAAYQVSLKGLQFLKTLPNSLFEEVNGFVYAPQAPHYETELLEAKYDGTQFVLRSRSGFLRTSGITDVEDVPYVTSPFLPICLRTRWGKSLTNNASRANECADTGEDIVGSGSVAIVLSYVNVLLGEWIPMGANNIVALNDRLGAYDRCQGGLFTDLVDRAPNDTNFKVEAGLTGIRIIDFDLVHFVNFEADIRLPEESGIVQIEHFAMHMNRDGSILCGMRMDAVSEAKEINISVDMLCRVLIDAQQDSSKILDHLLSTYQRGIMNVIFMGDSERRGKFSIVIADEIEPKMPARRYMDRGQYENEIKQITGSIIVADDVGTEDVIFIGTEGMLLAGPSAVAFEPLVLFYASLACQESFVKSFFLRTFVLIDTTSKIRQLMLQYHTDPQNLGRIRMALTEASRDIIALEEIITYLNESMHDCHPPQMPEDSKTKRLQSVLNVHNMMANVKLRIRDLTKLVTGASNQVDSLVPSEMQIAKVSNLQDAVNKIDTKTLEAEFKSVEVNTKVLVDASAANDRASAALAVMNIVLAGNFAFDILDRLAGGTMNFTIPQWAQTYIVFPLVAPAGVWFLVNMTWMAVLCYILTRLMRHLEKKASGSLKFYAKLNKRLKSEDGLLTFLATKVIIFTTTSSDGLSTRKEIEWKEEDAEKWLGSAPLVEMVIDDQYMFLISVTLTLDSKTSNCSEEDLLSIFLQDMVFSEALDRVEAFGNEAEAGEIERALAISKMQGAAAGAQKGAMLGWLGGGTRRRKAAQGGGPAPLTASK